MEFTIYCDMDGVILKRNLENYMMMISKVILKKITKEKDGRWYKNMVLNFGVI